MHEHRVTTGVEQPHAIAFICSHAQPFKLHEGVIIFSMFISFSSRADRLTTQGQVTPLNVYSKCPQRLTMRCSERLRVSRRVLSASGASATFGASAVRSTVGHAPRHAPPSLSLGSLGRFTRHEQFHSTQTSALEASALFRRRARWLAGHRLGDWRAQLLARGSCRSHDSCRRVHQLFREALPELPRATFYD